MCELEVNCHSATRVGDGGVELILHVNVFVHDTYRVWGTCDSLAYNMIPLKHQVILVARR